MTFFVSLHIEMRHFALIGRTLKHSFSKEYFDAQHFADADYRLCEMPTVDNLRRWVDEESLDGFNVTVPYKQAVLPQLDRLDPVAAAIGAVNCVVAGPDGRLTGHNTDGPAFRESLAALSFPVAQAFVLGTGGAARAVAWALRQLDIPCRFVSRRPGLHPGAIAYSDLHTSLRTPLSTLIVNATPVGTWPDVDRTPLPALKTWLSAHRAPLLLYDLVYNPCPTLLMRQAEAAGAVVCGGLDMLHRQARHSWRLWGLD